MKLFILSIIVALSTFTNSAAQKLVIGSTVPSLKEIKWIGEAPKPGTAFLIDFYQDSNPTCKQYFAKLLPIWQTYPDKVTIVILTRDDNDAIAKLAEKFGDKYFFGIDPTGNTFTSYGIKYLPSTILTDAKSKIIWMGNLGNLPQSMLDKL